MTDPPKNYVPATIRDKSRIVAWLWRYAPAQWLTYERAHRLARWLP